MSEQKIDKLFKDKLANNKVKPSVEAWEELALELKKKEKTKTPFYWYVAASVLLLMGASILFLKNDTIPIVDNSSTQIQEEVKPDIIEETPVFDKDLTQTTVAPIKEQKTPVNDNIGNIEAKEEQERKILPVEERNVYHQYEEDKLAQTDSEAVEPETPINELLEDESLTLLTLNDEIPTSEKLINQEEYPEIRIVYKASKKTEHDRNTLQKVVELARDIRQADIGLGTLRDAKNELLAFSLKKEKEPLEK